MVAISWFLSVVLSWKMHREPTHRNRIPSFLVTVILSGMALGRQSEETPRIVDFNVFEVIVNCCDPPSNTSKQHSFRAPLALIYGDVPQCL
jgi:hypothetical protein